nr:unnamed protein product [Callosobruchus chinensis]
MYTYKIYQMYLSINELSDPRLKDAWVLGKPMQILAIAGIYLYFVKKLGPQLMENRKPLEIKKIIMVYDLVQVVLNAYVTWQAAIAIWGISWKCAPVDYSMTNPGARTVIFAGQVYFWLKILDLLDTVFFVLRKSYRQVSFLHLYHHTVMLLGIWFGMTFFAGGDGIWLVLVNGFVHTVMFLYYFLAAYDPIWKKNITIQFLFFTLKFSHLFIQKDCEYPKLASILFVPQNLFMLCLFSDFYLKTYVGTMTSIMHMVVENYSEFIPQ